MQRARELQDILTKFEDNSIKPNVLKQKFDPDFDSKPEAVKVFEKECLV